MKKIKITFRISTALIYLMMFNSAYMCFASAFMKNSLMHLGFPGYFRIELGITKILGALALILPFIHWRIKEWAYAGFFIMFISGVMAHFIVGDPAAMRGARLTALMVLLVSYISHQKLHVEKFTTKLILKFTSLQGI